MGFRGEPFAFNSPAAAIAGMLASLHPDPSARSTEARTLHLARGRVLAQRINADRDSPAFDHAAMDGYAVRTGALSASAGAPLPVTAEARIGCPPPEMPAAPGVVRIATGAPLPAGADAVIKREDVREITEGSRVVSISLAPHIASNPRPGDNIRRRAENAGAGAVLLEPGTVLSAAAIGTLAAVGATQPRVYSPIRVALITTGEELVPPDTAPGPYQVRNSNAAATRSVLSARPWIDVVRTTHAGDRESAVVGELRDAIDRADALILSGGVSMGHRDPVRGAVEACGATIIFHGLPQRPGKPMLGAVLTRTRGARIPIFGLPGNPVSAMVTSERIVVPVLAACAGVTRWPSPPRVPLAGGDAKLLSLWWHRLVRLNDLGQAEPVDARGSGDVVAGGRAHGFVEIPPDVVGTGAEAPPTFPYYAWPS